MHETLLSSSNWNANIPFIPFYVDPYKYEISCVLFEACNLHCKFCFEEKSNIKIDPDYILSIPDRCLEEYKRASLPYKNIHELRLMFWGGEVFFDELPNSMFDTYKQMVDKFNILFKQEYPDLNLVFTWMSNGVNTKWDRIEDLLRYCNGKIGFSYDPMDRFETQEQEDMMIASANHFNELGLCFAISITLTKPCIDKFISGQTKLKYFNDQNINIDVNYYIPNPEWKSLIANDDDLYNFFKYAIDNKLYNIKIVEKFYQLNYNTIIQKQCDCKQCSQLTFGKWTTNCAKRSSVLPEEDFFGDSMPYVTDENTNDIAAIRGMLKRGCLQCEYFNRCQMLCWTSFNFKGFIPTVCPLYKAYKYIASNPIIQEEYDKWKKF